MKTNFDGDELKIFLEKGERDWLRKIRNITKELGRYHPHATAASEAITKVLSLVKDDGEFEAAKQVEHGNTNVVDPKSGETTATGNKDAGVTASAGMTGGR